jgi:hypothetical protein
VSEWAEHHQEARAEAAHDGGVYVEVASLVDSFHPLKSRSGSREVTPKMVDLCRKCWLGLRKPERSQDLEGQA